MKNRDADADRRLRAGAAFPREPGCRRGAGAGKDLSVVRVVWEMAALPEVLPYRPVRHTKDELLLCFSFPGN